MLDSGRSRHEQISDWVRTQIEEGRYQVDEQLPSESELCERFDVSRITVRRALQTLESEELIYRRQGLGSFVKEPRAKPGMARLTDFAQDMAQAGLEATSEVLFHGQENASPLVATKLEVEPDTPVVQLDRLRLGDGRPMAFDRTWLPLFYGQLLERYDLQTETIYGILEREYELPVLRGQYRIEAVNARKELVQPLEVEEGQALLRIDRLSLTAGERCVYFQQRYYRTDRVAYELELERDPDRRGAPLNAHALHRLDPVFHAVEE